MKRHKQLTFVISALAVPLTLFVLVRVVPIFETLRLSLFKWDIISRNKPFIGLANFQELASDPLFLEALRNTTIIAVGAMRAM